MDEKLYNKIIDISKDYEELKKKYYNFIQENIEAFNKNQNSKEMIFNTIKKIDRWFSKIFKTLPNRFCFVEYVNIFHGGVRSDLIRFEKNFKKFLLKSLTVQQQIDSILKEKMEVIEKEYKKLLKEFNAFVENHYGYFNEDNKRIIENIPELQNTIEENIAMNL